VGAGPGSSNGRTRGSEPRWGRCQAAVGRLTEHLL
jgi:hypothetical protein